MNHKLLIPAYQGVEENQKVDFLSRIPFIWYVYSLLLC